MHSEHKCTLPRKWIDTQGITDEPQTFQQYISTLFTWTQYLLRHIDFVWDKEDITMLLQQKEQLYLVTDGGTSDGIWYLAG